MIIAVRVGLELGAAKTMVIHNMYISRSFPDFRYSLQVMLCTQCGQFSPYGIYKFLLPFKIVKLLSHFLPLTVFIA